MIYMDTHTWQFKGVIKITAVNCNTQKKICDEYGVKDFPTLKVIPPGGFGTQDYTGECVRECVLSIICIYAQCMCVYVYV
jgi:hypothetical protein